MIQGIAKEKVRAMRVRTKLHSYEKLIDSK
jgi:hypothetical protein